MNHIHKIDEQPLACGEYTYNVEPDRFVFDFKQMTPQFGPGGQDMQLVITHKVVTLDPWLAKVLASQLSQAIVQYEQQFGEIRQSAAAVKAQEIAAKQVRVTSEKPSYMG